LARRALRPSRLENRFSASRSRRKGERSSL
jgi:hypothetical protein